MYLIAIDGPSGAGKSTLATALSEQLGIERLDTGAMYRAVALAALQAGVDLDDEHALLTLATEMNLEMGEQIILDGVDVSQKIREPDVTAVASKVAAKAAVRRELVRRQQAWITQHGGGVVEGRDIASVVAPDADVKVYLTADLDERGRRRTAELDANVLAELDVHDQGDVEESLAERDERDATRAASPLVKVPGALVIDSTHLSVEEIVKKVLAQL